MNQPDWVVTDLHHMATLGLDVDSLIDVARSFADKDALYGEGRLLLAIPTRRKTCYIMISMVKPEMVEQEDSAEIKASGGSEG